MITQEIGELIDSVNELTGTVAGKMAEIDQKVDDATASVPSAIKSLADQTFYIDAISGSDSNSGGLNSPFKTIYRVQEELVNGSRIRIYLRTGQVHNIVGYGLTLQTGLIEFSFWGDYTGFDDRPTIRLTLINNSTDGTQVGHGATVRSGTVLLRGCNVECVHDSSKTISNQAGFIGYANSAMSVIFYNARMRLSNMPFIAAYSGYSGRDLYMSSALIEVVEDLNNNSKLISNRNSSYHTFKLDVYSVTLGSGVTWDNLIDYYDDKRNVLTNIVLP
ncbi:hypothetical protein [Vibrio crassostreae]|uniref:hypothetical protein n=1 Tax=Vibrio crassostreae TaxID=246167 RepID=UPI001B315D2E|nr:hypothetical protein [Vibrio crassostreae]